MLIAGFAKDKYVSLLNAAGAGNLAKDTATTVHDKVHDFVKSVEDTDIAGKASSFVKGWLSKKK